MPIIVKFLDGTSIEVPFSPSLTGAQIKQFVSDSFPQIGVDRQRLICMGKGFPSDDTSVIDMNIEDGNTVFNVLRLRPDRGEETVAAVGKAGGPQVQQQQQKHDGAAPDDQTEATRERDDRCLRALEMIKKD